MSVLYCQSPALFWCALALIVCFFVRRGAHRVRAVLDLVLGLLCVVGGVALYYLGMYNNAFTIRDFWYIRTAGWIGLAVVVLVTVWQVVKATRRSMSARRAARQAERDEKTRQKEITWSSCVQSTSRLNRVLCSECNQRQLSSMTVLLS